MSFDLPVRVCYLHRNQEVSKILRNAEVCSAIWEGMREMGFPHPEDFPIRVGFKQIDEPEELH